MGVRRADPAWLTRPGGLARGNPAAAAPRCGRVPAHASWSPLAPTDARRRLPDAPTVVRDAEGWPARVAATVGRHRLELVRAALQVPDARCPTGVWRVLVDHADHGAEFRASVHDDVETLLHLGAYVAGVWR